MEKPKVTGYVKEFHGNKFLQNGAEVLTIILAWTFEAGNFKKEMLTPIGFYGKDGLDKLKEKVSIGDKITVPFLPSGRLSKNGEFWNAELQGDHFQLTVDEKAKPEIGFGEPAPGNF